MCMPLGLFLLKHKSIILIDLGPLVLFLRRCGSGGMLATAMRGDSLVAGHSRATATQDLPARIDG